MFELHPQRGVEILKEMSSIPSDVLVVIGQHHENCAGTGYPLRLRRGAIHPMAKLISVASEFCELVIKTPRGPGISPREALVKMESLSANLFDPQFFNALRNLFHSVA
jgi:HD-GYP domain-containing protein (c-di-GMP phosphodiesterase class II)